MQIDIPYSPGYCSLEIPDDIQAVVLAPNEVGCRDTPESLSRALENPVNSVSLKEFMDSGEDILILINDATRPTPTARLLEEVMAQTGNQGIRFLVATGTHRPPTKNELRAIMGRFYRPFRDRIHVHDARDHGELVGVGVSPSGGELRVNKRVARAGKIITINSVEPHYFAGYTGGRKTFFPGVAGYRSVEENHGFALSKNARPLKLAGNPVHLDMVRSLAFLKDKEIFSIQSVLDRHHRIYSLKAGDIQGSFIQSIPKADKVFSVKVPHRADIVMVVVTPPKSINLYQAQNAIENAKLILKKGGILLLVSPCSEGVGPPAFFDLLSRCPKPDAVVRMIGTQYRLGYHKAVKFAETAEEAEMWAVTGLPDSLLEKVFMRGFSNLQQAVDRAIDVKGRQATLVILMDGDKTVPRIAG